MNILVNGICGFMGREVVKSAAENYGGACAVGGIDCFDGRCDLPRASSFEQAKNLFDLGSVDCVIDFSNRAQTCDLLAFCVENGLPVVVATTGHTEQEVKAIEAAAEKIPVFYAANMSIGVALLIELAKKAASVMPEADIEIIEKHHNRKLDAPSGTAMAIYRALKTVREKANAVLGRSGMKKREVDDIGIHAVRMGNIVGEHEVILCTPTQSISLKHEAYDRALFAQGAITAAGFLIQQKNGLYSMDDLVSEWRRS